MVVLFITINTTIFAQNSTGYESWSSTKIYANAGNIVYFEEDGKSGLFENRWWSKGDKPSFVPSSSNPWKSIKRFDLESNQAPTWNQNGEYEAGSLVSWQGYIYKAKWWNRGKEPIAYPTNSWDTPWQMVSKTQEIQQTSPTEVSQPTQPTQPVQTQTNDSAKDILFEQKQVYTAGDIVYYEGKYYKAKWWTYGSTPRDLLLDPEWISPWQEIDTLSSTTNTSNITPSNSSNTDKTANSSEQNITNTTKTTKITLPKGGYELLSLLTPKDWDWFFPFRFGHYNPNGGTYNKGTTACELLGLSGDVKSNTECDIFTLDAFKEAVVIYNDYASIHNLAEFLNEGSLKQQIEELSAFLSNVSRETSGSWATAPIQDGGWIEDDPIIDMIVWKGGLYWIEEVGYTTNPDGTVKSGGIGYVDTNSQWKPVPNRSYHGRGPIQLSWNYNYGQFSAWLYDNNILPDIITSRDTLLKNPALVNKNAIVSFLSAIWFWMTPQDAKPSAHDVILGKVTNVSKSTHDRGLPQRNDGGIVPTEAGSTTNKEVMAYRVGTTINIINGRIECNGSAKWHDGPPQRVSYYEAYIRYLNSISDANGLELGIGYMATQKAPYNSEIKSLATCTNQKSYYGW